MPQTSAQRDPGARDRLRAWLAEHPDPCGAYSLTTIAAQIGVTTERARQLMPDYARRRRDARDARILRYIEDHPAALLKRSDGGMGLHALARELGVSVPTLRATMRRLGIPTVQYTAGRYAHQARSNEYARAYGREIVGTATCIECGTAFPLKRSTRRNIRKGLMREVCSVRCGKAASRRLGPKNIATLPRPAQQEAKSDV